MNEASVLLSERKELGAVRLLGADSISLTIGPITIALAPTVFAQAAILIREAMESLAVVVAVGEIDGDGTDISKAAREPLPN